MKNYIAALFIAVGIVIGALGSYVLNNDKDLPQMISQAAEKAGQENSAAAAVLYVTLGSLYDGSIEELAVKVVEHSQERLSALEGVKEDI